ncbi:MAG TPA: PAS domain S-box protein [Bacteroidales bacterium]|nr:PAS domain S-box protein [Bacteroidales bacterium]
MILNTRPHWRIAGIYLIVGLSWIIFSDVFLLRQINNLESMRLFQTYKGWFFVIITALLLFFLIKRYFFKILATQKSLNETRQHYSLLFKNNPQAMWIFDNKNQRIFEVNEAAQILLGYNEDEFLKLKVDELFDPNDLDELGNAFNCRLNPFHRSSGHRLRKKNGSYIDVELICNQLPLKNSDCFKLVMVIDITGLRYAFKALKASEKALKDSERQLTNIMENLPGMAYRCLNDSNFSMLSASKGCYELTGYLPDALINNEEISFFELIHPDDQQKVISEVKKMVQDKLPGIFDYRIITSAGQVKWVWDRTVGVYDDANNLLFFEGFLLDISGQRTAEKALIDQNILLSNILNNLPFPLFYKNLQGKIMGCNTEFEKYLGLQHEQIVGKQMAELGVVENKPEIDENDHLLLTLLKDYNRDMVIKYRDGSQKNVVYNKSLFFDSEGIPQGIIGVYFDISERIKNENIIRKHLEDLERINSELDQFTYIVSHDFRSPLITIKGSLPFLVSDFESGDRAMVKEGLERITSATNRMHQLLEDLLKLSRSGRLGNPSSWFSMENLVSELSLYLHGLLKEGEANLEVVSVLPDAYGDRSRVAEAIQNLIENAVKFRNPSEKLRIEIGSKREDGQVCYYIKDNGLGIEPKNLEKVFYPFVRFNANIQGTGLGLAVVKRIIEHHGGKVWAKSEGSNQGTSFYFTLGPQPPLES